MDADPRDQRIRELEAKNTALRTQVQAQAEQIEQLRQLIRQPQDRIEELERAAAITLGCDDSPKWLLAQKLMTSFGGFPWGKTTRMSAACGERIHRSSLYNPAYRIVPSPR